MFSKLAIFLTSVAVLAVATPMPGGGGSAPAGTPLCCESTGTASDPGVASVLAGLGITVQDVDALIGLTCSPITVRFWSSVDASKFD